MEEYLNLNGSNGNSQGHLLMSLNGSSGGFCLLAGDRISSQLENGSWDVARKEKKRDLTRRPSRRELERDAHAAKGKKQEAEQRTKRNPKGRAGEPANRNLERPGTGRPGQGEDKTPGQKHVSRLRVPVLGWAPFVRFWGRRPRAVPLNPPPF